MSISLAAAFTLVKEVFKVSREVDDIVSSNMSSNNSLVSYSQSLRVEPLCIMDRSVAINPIASSLMQFVHSSFAGFYLQAISVDNRIGGISVSNRIERYNPNRHKNSGIIGKGIQLSTEGFNLEANDLVPFGTIGPKHDSHVQDSKVDRFARDVTNQIKEIHGTLDNHRRGVNVTAENAIKEIKEETHLGLGKLITVDLRAGRDTIRLPVAIKINAWSMAPNDIVGILSHQQVSESLKERIFLWRKGDLTTADLLFCKDIIKNARKEMMKDKTGAIRQEAARQINNRMRAISTGRTGAADLSNIAIISKDTQVLLEGNIGGKIDDFKTREQVFAKSGLMLLCVVDTDYDRIKVYYQSIARPTDLSFRDIEKSKNNDSNIGDILQSLLLSQPPRL